MIIGCRFPPAVAGLRRPGESDATPLRTFGVIMLHVFLAVRFPEPAASAMVRRRDRALARQVQESVRSPRASQDWCCELTGARLLAARNERGARDKPPDQLGPCWAEYS